MIAATVRDTYYLTLRSLREVARQPAFEIQNYFIPLFFFAVTVGAIGNVSARAFGVDNYQAFQMPVAGLEVILDEGQGIGMIGVFLGEKKNQVYNDHDGNKGGEND